LENQVDLVAKVEGLQKNVFWTKCVAIVLFLSLATVNVANWASRQRKTIEATEFLLRDKDAGESLPVFRPQQTKSLSDLSHCKPPH
jgi:hypothetical protein